MSDPDAVPLPREGEVFFDVRGEARSMRLSWYADSQVAVFSIWQADRCTGTFRLPFADLARMIGTLQSGPGPRSGQAPARRREDVSSRSDVHHYRDSVARNDQSAYAARDHAGSRYTRTGAAPRTRQDHVAPVAPSSGREPNYRPNYTAGSSYEPTRSYGGPPEPGGGRYATEPHSVDQVYGGAEPYPYGGAEPYSGAGTYGAAAGAYQEDQPYGQARSAEGPQGYGQADYDAAYYSGSRSSWDAALSAVDPDEQEPSGVPPSPAYAGHGGRLTPEQTGPDTFPSIPARNGPTNR